MNLCTKFQNELAARAAGEKELSAESKSHLRGCEHCRARFAQWKWVAGNLSESAGNLPLPKHEPRLETWFAQELSGTSERSLSGVNFGRVLGGSVAAVVLVVLCVCIISIVSPRQTGERAVTARDDPAIGNEADPISPAAAPTLGAMRRELQAANAANFVPMPHAPEGFRSYRLKEAYLESRN